MKTIVIRIREADYKLFKQLFPKVRKESNASYFRRIVEIFEDIARQYNEDN